MIAKDSMWFNTARGSFGFVLGENETTGERKLYAGIVDGLDQGVDEQSILSLGSRVNIRLLEGLIAKTKKKDRGGETMSLGPGLSFRNFECPTGWSDCDSCEDKTGQEESGLVVCGRRPKQFSCVCGFSQFILIERRYTGVDFSQEGAIEGHPYIQDSRNIFDSFVCSKCGEKVPDREAQEMRKEVI